MGKQQEWSVAACVFVFLSLTSQINCAKRGISSVSGASPKTAITQKEKDLVKSLPGQPPVTFKQYGGYVAINETAGRYFYYYLMEAVNANASTPLCVYLEGGPFDSSLFGALSMFGPFRVHSDGKTLFRNPYAWNNEANFLYIESPSGTGYSYSNTPSDIENEGDKMTAEDNYTFLVNWLERFPEYIGREFYITGESYGGHYVPQLTKIILQRSNQTFINLRGILIGNPLLDRALDENLRNEYLLSHAIISQQDFDEQKQSCVEPFSEKCTKANKRIGDLIKDLDAYNIYAPKCIFKLTSEPDTPTMEFHPCRSKYLEPYLNSTNVRKAMHNDGTYLQGGWEGTKGQQFKESDEYASMQPILQELISAKDLRIWLFSGDLDFVCPSIGTMAVLKRMNLTVEKRWRAWMSDEEVGGYTEEYKGNLVFATVRGAGHNVANHQPKRALTLFTSFLHNTPLPLPRPRGDSFEIHF